VTLTVYDILGREVTTLLEGHLQAGMHAVDWNATDASGRIVPSGVYIYRITAAEGSRSRAMTLAK